jgi:hypothetical protein
MYKSIKLELLWTFLLIINGIAIYYNYNSVVVVFPIVACIFVIRNIFHKP